MLVKLTKGHRGTVQALPDVAGTVRRRYRDEVNGKSYHDFQSPVKKKSQQKV